VLATSRSSRSHRSVLQLGDVIELVYGKALPKNQRKLGKVSVYGSNGLVGYHDTAIVNEPTVIVGRKGSAGAIQFVNEPCYPIDTTYYVRPRPRIELDIEFMFYMLWHLDLARLRTATGVPGLNREDVYRLSVNLPPISEQRRIVDILKRADGIRRLRKQAIQTARELIPALFVDMFGDPATNPKGWERVPFSTVGTLDRGKSKHRPRNAPILFGGSYPFIQTGEVANSGGRIRSFSITYSEQGLAQSRLWPKGTLCITIAANIAETGVLEFDACFPDSVVGFLPGPRVTTEFVQAWLAFLQPTLAANAPQLAQKNINLKILGELPIPTPPIDLQQEFSRRRENVESVIGMQTASNQQSDVVFQSILHRAFRGEL
jgi:type I restriction enzyme, S subunit